MQRPVRLKPINSTSTTASFKHGSPYRPLISSQENKHLLNNTQMDIRSRRHMTAEDVSHGISPYCLPVINNFVTPVPPLKKKNDRELKVTAGSTIRTRRLRPATSSSGSQNPSWLSSSVYQSRVCVNMVYFGKTVHLSNDLIDSRDEVKVFQQHCGGENLCVYKGELREGEAFQFISRRHRGFPFSLTFYLNGLQVERLSSCCEFKHRRGARLGGRHGYFGFSNIEGASPCYKCIIEMGLDKKPSPPKRVIRDRSEVKSATSLKDETETPIKETTDREETEAVESKVKDDYEEDFEADDEGPVEETTLREEKSPSLFSETELPDQEKDASQAEDEEDDIEKGSSSGSRMSGSDEESDGEATKHSEDDETEDTVKEDGQPEADQQKPEETVAARVQSASVNNSDIVDSAMDSTGIEISGTSVSMGNEDKLSSDTSEDKERENPGNETKIEYEQERAKSVQEKLAEAILNVSHCSSEPELSDTTTEEEEGPAHKLPRKENQEQLQTPAEEANCEESVREEAVEKEFPETEEENEPDHGDNPQEERTSEAVENEEAADCETTRGDKSEEQGKTQPTVDGENVAHDDKIEDPFEGSESSNVEAASNTQEKGGKDAEKPDIYYDETEELAKSKDEDDSSVLEQSEQMDKTAVADIAEAEATATTETKEIKAESSEEREALSREEVPETGIDKMQADSEEARVTVENLRISPEEFWESTAERTSDMHAETVKTQSSFDEMHLESKQQASKADDGEGEPVEVNEAAEIQTLANSEEKTADENETKEIPDESVAAESIKYKKTPSEGTEDIPGEGDEDGVTETDTEAKGERVKVAIDGEELEAKRDDKGPADAVDSKTNKALQEKDEEERQSEDVEKEKCEEAKTDEVCGDVIKNSISEGREALEHTDELEKMQDGYLDTENVELFPENIADSENASESKVADGTETHEQTPDVSQAGAGEGEVERESEKGEINTENGESSVAAEREPQEDEENAPTSGEGRQTDEPDEENRSPEKKIAVESGDNAENLTDQAPEIGIAESDAKEADGVRVKHGDAVNLDSEPGTSEAERQEEKSGNGEAENKEFNLIQNTGNDAAKVYTLHKTSSVQIAADVEKTTDQDEEGKLQSITEKPLETEENGEDVEEASKASEEGASVLLKPLTQNNAVVKESPEALAGGDNTDMVTNWIQMHQMSKFFETFVEPLEELKEDVPDAPVCDPNGGENDSEKLLRSESPMRMAEDKKEPRDVTQIKAQESHDHEQGEKELVEGGLQGSEETEEKSLELNKFDSGGSKAEEKEEGNTAFRTDGFSASLNAEDDFENQNIGSANSSLELVVEQAAADLPFKTDKFNSLNGEKDKENTSDNLNRDGIQISQIIDFATSNSADGREEVSHNEDIQTKLLEQRFSGETRDIQLIEDIRHTLSKERLSTFSLFAQSSYPLLTTSKSEGGK
ncbi:PREDICTED: glutamate-rich protein 3 isoform X1 [Cyprinodon variegatus]|uniref:glutamate-rich protein 3 isoform X1 n=1 Tax=Cyprinodon variegatus TaxID=28743 RepID=UPI0007426433|nr:PREDICTED: glutamate-rich protein 3 isoform X1 [Cyprinodon variegatus]